MTRLLLPLSLVAALALSADASAHGGTYRGPGDTVPPSGGGSTAPTAPTGPAAPTAPSAPGAPAPSAPSTPSTPAMPAAPTSTTSTPAVTMGRPTGPDLSTWEFWWGFNKEPYLNLKAKVQAGSQETGEGDVLIGLSAGGSSNNTRRPSKSQIQGTIVPTLLDALRNESNVDLISSCLVALGKIGENPEIPPAIQPFLKNQNQEIAETAGLAMGILQDEEAIPALMHLLRNSDVGQKLAGKNVPLRTQTFAAYGLGLIGHSSTNEEVKEQIAKDLWEFLSTDESPLKDIRAACVISIGILQLEDPFDEIEKLQSFMANEDNNFLVRAHCPTAIAKLLAGGDDEKRVAGRQKAAELFIQTLGSRGTPPEVRQSCVQSLGLVTRGNSPFAEKVVRALINTAENGRDLQEKNFTAISLAYIAANPAKATANPVQELVIEFLMKSMSRGASTYEPWAGLALGVMSFKMNEQGEAPSPIVARQLRGAFMKEKNPSKKSCYAISLGLMKNESAKKDIRDVMLESKNPELRGYTAVALGLLNAREYKDDIARILDESRRLPDLLKQVSIGLGLMQDREVVGKLLDLMRDDSGGTPPLAVLGACATALGFIGDTTSVDPLVGMMENPDVTPLARAFAAVALGIVADEELLPWNSKISEDVNYRAAVSTLVDVTSSKGILDIL